MSVDWPQFGAVAGVLVLVVFVAGAVLTPPDPYSQLRFAVPGVAAALLVALLVALDTGE